MVYTSPFLAVTGPAPRPTVAEGNSINEAVPMKTVSALRMRQPCLPGRCRSNLDAVCRATGSDLCGWLSLRANNSREEGQQ